MQTGFGILKPVLEHINWFLFTIGGQILFLLYFLVNHNVSGKEKDEGRKEAMT